MQRIPRAQLLLLRRVSCQRLGCDSLLSARALTDFPDPKCRTNLSAADCYWVATLLDVQSS